MLWRVSGSLASRSYGEFSSLLFPLEVERDCVGVFGGGGSVFERVGGCEMRVTHLEVVWRRSGAGF